MPFKFVLTALAALSASFGAQAPSSTERDTIPGTLVTFEMVPVPAGTVTIDGTPVDIEGAKVRKFTMPEGVSIYFATAANAVILSPSKAAISRAVALVVSMLRFWPL